MGGVSGLFSHQEDLQVLFVDTGYKYDLAGAYKTKLSLLSGFSSGMVLTHGEVGRLSFGKYEVHSYPTYSSKTLMFFRALYLGARILNGSRRSDQPFNAIISYDPLYTGLIALILSLAFRVPLVVELNGDYTNDSNYADVSGRIRRYLKKNIYLLVAGEVLKRASGIKCLYSRQLDYFKARHKLRAAVRVFPNYLDVSNFVQLGESKTLSLVGFPFAVKGVDVAVAAFKAVSDRYPEWTLEILGWYPGKKGEHIDAIIAGHPRIKRLSPLTREQMPTYVGSRGIFVCASRTEGFPRIIKEAMHAGKPCVASDVGGLPDAIIHGFNGLLFRSEAVVELASGMDVLMGDSALRARLGMAAADFAKAEYGKKSYADRYLEFLLAARSAAT